MGHDPFQSHTNNTCQHESKSLSVKKLFIHWPTLTRFRNKPGTTKPCNTYTNLNSSGHCFFATAICKHSNKTSSVDTSPTHASIRMPLSLTKPVVIPPVHGTRLQPFDVTRSRKLPTSVTVKFPNLAPLTRTILQGLLFCQFANPTELKLP